MHIDVYDIIAIAIDIIGEDKSLLQIFPYCIS